MDKQEFTARVLAMEGRLYRISRGLLAEEQDRLDAAQEAVIRAWQNLSRLRHEEFFETWFTRILINECRNIQRSAAGCGSCRKTAQAACRCWTHPSSSRRCRAT